MLCETHAKEKSWLDVFHYQGVKLVLICSNLMNMKIIICLFECIFYIRTMQNYICSFFSFKKCNNWTWMMILGFQQFILSHDYVTAVIYHQMLSCRVFISFIFYVQCYIQILLGSFPFCLMQYRGRNWLSGMLPYWLPVEIWEG